MYVVDDKDIHFECTEQKGTNYFKNFSVKLQAVADCRFISLDGGG